MPSVPCESFAAPALPGHYQPPTRTLAMLDAASATLGVGHYVLVQPSVYGTDNSLLLDALSASAGRHRGVVVVDHGETWRVSISHSLNNASANGD